MKPKLFANRLVSKMDHRQEGIALWYAYIDVPLFNTKVGGEELGNADTWVGLLLEVLLETVNNVLC